MSRSGGGGARLGAAAEAARRVMLHTSTGPLRPLWGLAYRLCARAVAAYLRRGRPDCAVYTLGDVAGPDAVYGVSDIDLAVVAPGAPGRPGEVRRTILARWERLRRKLPPLGELLHVAVYEPPDLERGLAGSPSLGVRGAGGLSRRRALFQPSTLGKPPDVALRAGFGLPRGAWRPLAGADRLPLAAADHESKVAAWLELQYWWRHAFSICLRPSGPRTPYTCVKLVAEPVRIWLWLTRGERVRTREEVLQRGLAALPEEREALTGALALLRELHHSPRPSPAAAIAACLRLSARIARWLASEVEHAGATEVRLAWGGEQQLALADGARDPLAAVLGAEPRLLPLADWRALVHPSQPDETFALVPGDPADDHAVAALAHAGASGPYAALSADGLLVLPAPLPHRAKLRSLQCALTDPVSFALLEGAGTARFPNSGGWSIHELAARAIVEHRIWLARTAGAPMSPAEGARLLGCARAALLLESLESGAPELPLTLAASAAALGERHGGARAAAEESYELYAGWRAGGAAPPSGAPEALRRHVVGLAAYRRGSPAAGVHASMSP